MAVLTIRNIDDAIKAGLRVQAARHGWSMEEEVRKILAGALQSADAGLPLGQRMQRRFAGTAAGATKGAAAGLKMPVRKPVRAAPDFGQR